MQRAASGVASQQCAEHTHSLSDWLQTACLFAVAVFLYYLCTLLNEGIGLLREMVGLLHERSDAKAEGSAPAAAAALPAVAEEEEKKVDELRPLKVSTAEFAQALLGETDVATGPFIEACRAYSTVLKHLGPWTSPSIREVHANCHKIEHAYEMEPSKYRSMRALLQAEKSLGLHKEGAILHDPSAAMGLLWARRGLKMWVHLFRERADSGPARSSEGGAADTGAFKRQVDAAYNAVLLPFQGWLSSRAFALGSLAIPAAFPPLAPTEAEMEEDLRAWLDVMEQVLGRMATMHHELDLEDTRKSI